MSAFLVAVVSAVVIPIALMVLNRHYSAKPKEWEAVFVGILAGGLAIAAGIWVGLMGSESDSYWVRLAVVGLGCWTLLGGLIAGGVSIGTAVDLIRATDNQQQDPR